MKRILITGHAGYLGTLLSPALTTAGYQPHGLDSGLFNACDFGQPAPPIPHISKDLRDLNAGDLEGFDAVVHLAGLSNDPLGDFDPALTEQINDVAAVELARLAKQAGVGRFIAASSCSVYGASDSDDLLTEAAPFNPVTPYARAKAHMEEAMSGMADAQFQPVFIRPATVYGVSPRIRFDLVLNNLVAWAVATGQVLLKSDGMAWRPLLHARDLIKAIVELLEAPADKVANRAFNLVRTDQNFRIRELAALVEQGVPGSKVVFQDGYIHDQRNYRVNGDLLTQTLPELTFDWTVQAGVKELYEAFIQQGVRQEDFEGKRYQRLAHLKAAIAEGRISTDLRPIGQDTSLAS